MTVTANTTTPRPSDAPRADLPPREAPETVAARDAAAAQAEAAKAAAKGAPPPPPAPPNTALGRMQAKYGTGGKAKAPGGGKGPGPTMPPPPPPPGNTSGGAKEPPPLLDKSKLAPLVQLAFRKVGEARKAPHGAWDIAPDTSGVIIDKFVDVVEKYADFEIPWFQEEIAFIVTVGVTAATCFLAEFLMKEAIAEHLRDKAKPAGPGAGKPVVDTTGTVVS